MRRNLLLLIISLLSISGFLLTEPGLAYYYPPSNTPPGPPPNYNQVDTTYFLGTPELGVPADSGGIYIYYDQGTWCAANHIYSAGNSLEQFHCCVLAELNQPPTLGVNVFIEEFELWSDTTDNLCLKQNDRWGWYPWGDSLYEIWWDVTTREWKLGEGDPNDFMCFSIAGCAIDFNFWSSGHGGQPFGPDQIFLGVNKTRLSSVPGFTDTYPGINDPYQSQAGTDPTGDPNITIFTWKSDAQRSYNKSGLIDPADSYTCNLAVQYGQRYAGSFAYEGDGVEFSTSPFSLPNYDPNIFITPDTSVFLCGADSVRIWIFASDPDAGDTITVEKTYGTGTYNPVTDLTPISDEFYFHPDTSGVYTFVFRVTDDQGATGEDTSHVTVTLNQPPQITVCPSNGSAHAGDTFVSTSFSVTDPDGDPVAVAVLDVTPSPTNAASIVGDHVEWLTTCAEDGDYVIRLVAADDCEAQDTCEFTVNVYNQPPQLTCPNNGSVHAGETFVSSNFSVTDPDGDTAPVTFLDITPSATNNPSIVGNHVEWITSCAENGDYVIRLVATDSCGARDTCQFTVNVYNQPPVLTCPENGTVKPGSLFVSSDYTAADPDDPSGVVVSIASISPTPVNAPTLVDTHVEWQTTGDDLVNGPDFTITLVATDPCGLADTCDFLVTVSNPPPVITPPPDDSVHAGHYFVSEDFSVSDAKGSVTVTICGINPASAHAPTIVENHVELQTECGEAGIVFTICLEATDDFGAKDTGYFDVTVYNNNPQLTCPDDDSVHATEIFISTGFSVYDPDGDPVTVALLDITPAAIFDPIIVGYHVEWHTTCEEDGDYLIRLAAVDSCGAEDTCGFTVTVYNRPPEITCPEDDSVHAGDTFVSTDFSVYDPDGDFISVYLLDITPQPTHYPTVVDSHVVWETTCDDIGVYVIRLVASEMCQPADTCGFTVTVYNRPPDLVCPLDDTANAGYLFVSGDFSVSDPDDPTGVVVTLESVSPTPTYPPSIVDNHLEWETCCGDLVAGPVFTFTLVASDPCGAKDTCEFEVTVYDVPPEIICPRDDSVHAGAYFVSSDFSVSDLRGEPATVSLCGIDPPPTSLPAIVQSHVEWQTHCADAGNIFTICLEATDTCGSVDSCTFNVKVYNYAPDLICPENGEVYAGSNFISASFSFTDPEGDSVTVVLSSVTPAPTNSPITVGNHVEWQTDCADANITFTICLEAIDSCGASDTCCFEVAVYNRPPELTCPHDSSVHAGETFVSGDFSATDPDGDLPAISLLDVTPAPSNPPQIVDNHVEWVSTCAEGGDYLIRLVATDVCGLKDTCGFTVNVYNQPPLLLCPDAGGVHATKTFSSTDFSVSDPEGDPTSVAILDISPSATNPPSIAHNHVEWVTTCAEEGNYVIRLVATDECGARDTCEFIVNVYNNPPQLVCPPDGSVEAGQTFISDDFSASDPDGDLVVVTFQSIAPFATYDPAIVGNHVEWLTANDEEGTYAITLRVTDLCGLFTECTFQVNVMPPAEGENKVMIAEIDCANPGDYVSLPIYLVNNTVPFGGFELEFEFDYTALCFVDAIRGELLLDSYTDQNDILWSWEYFTYRLLPCPIPPCQKYKILAYGQAEMPNGSMNRGLCIPENSTGVLFYLNFVVMNDENLRGLMIPVCFEWEGMVVDDVVVEDWECTENIFSSCDGNTIYTSALLCEFNPDVCDDPGGDIQRTMVFQAPICGVNCGGVLVCPAGPEACKRGDVNMNTVSYEVADAVLFANYFVYGEGVFVYDLAYQICATDANADGRPLTLSDLIYLIRVILQDAVEIPKLAPFSEVANVFVYNGTITAECAAPIAAMLFEFDRAVQPTLLANIEMVSSGDKVLVWSRDGHTFNTAEVLSFTGAQLVSVSAVDYNTRELKTTITAKAAPTAFALNPAYPNPFNPYVNLSFLLPEATSYSLKIYNVAGQLVRSYEGIGSTDLNVITWDGRDNAGTEVASGVYFYKLTAGGLSATEKMVMMK